MFFSLSLKSAVKNVEVNVHPNPVSAVWCLNTLRRYGTTA